jgi:hypothetical protein
LENLRLRKFQEKFTPWTLPFPGILKKKTKDKNKQFLFRSNLSTGRFKTLKGNF